MNKLSKLVKNGKFNEIRIQLIVIKIHSHFNSTKFLFQNLYEPFYEDKKQNDCLIHFIFTCH
jgi:hypothetical protein